MFQFGVHQRINLLHCLLHFCHFKIRFRILRLKILYQWRFIYRLDTKLRIKSTLPDFTGQWGVVSNDLRVITSSKTNLFKIGYMSFITRSYVPSCQFSPADVDVIIDIINWQSSELNDSYILFMTLFLHHLIFYVYVYYMIIWKNMLMKPCFKRRLGGQKINYFS